MATPVLMPRQGQSVESCMLVDWLVPPGTAVKAGQPIASIETDKAVFEIESPADGTLLETFYKKGDDIPVLTTIAAIGTPGEDLSAFRPSTPLPPDRNPDPVPTPPSRAQHAEPSTSATPPAPSSGISPRARHLAAATGLDPATITGSGPDGRIIARDIAAAASASPRLSPAARDARASGGLSTPATGSGPGGMVLKSDLLPGGARSTAPALPAASAPPPPDIPGATLIPLTGIRKIIAERMRKSLASTAQLTLCRSVDATSILACRQQIKRDGAAKHLPNATLNDMIVFAVARALVKHPDLNAHFLGDRIARHSAINIGVATDTPRGLMVPVLRNAQSLSLAELSANLKPILASAQAGTIAPDLLRGGTFTITNLGMLGIEQFTPILNAPEVAILGVGGLTLKPVERNGKVMHVQSITLSLTIDHQAVDGAPGARFLGELAELLEGFKLDWDYRGKP